LEDIEEAVVAEVVVAMGDALGELTEDEVSLKVR